MACCNFLPCSEVKPLDPRIQEIASCVNEVIFSLHSNNQLTWLIKCVCIYNRLEKSIGDNHKQMVFKCQSERLNLLFDMPEQSEGVLKNDEWVRSWGITILTINSTCIFFKPHFLFLSFWPSHMLRSWIVPCEDKMTLHIIVKPPALHQRLSEHSF